MSQVNEKSDAQRVAEQQALQKREAAKKDEAKAQERGQEFAKKLNAIKQDQGQANKKNEGALAQMQAQKQTDSNQLLAAKGGIQNRFVTELLQKGEQSLKRSKIDSEERNDYLDKNRTEHQETESKREAQKHDALAAISEREQNQQENGGSMGGSPQQHSDSPEQTASGTATLAALSNVSGTQATNAPSTAAGTSPAITPQQLQELVKNVFYGVDQKGLGTAIIELNNSVFNADVRLQVTVGSQGEIFLQIKTSDEQTGRLLSSGHTANELQQALQAKGKSLKGLEVNDEKVIRS